MPADKPYSRGEFNRALLANALLDPFTVAVATVVLVLGIVLNLLPVGPPRPCSTSPG